MSRVSETARVVGVALLVVLSVLAGSAGAISDATETDELAVDHIHITIEVGAEGDANWVLEHRSRLDSDDRRDAFAAIAQDIDENPGAYIDPFEADMAETVALAAAATDREMRIADVSVSARTLQLPQEYGVIEYRFTWTGFAAVDGQELVIGDAVAGLFLDEASSMRLEWPQAYQVESISPTPDEEHASGVTWRGPTDFGTDEPRVTLSATTAWPSADWRPVALGGAILFGIIAAGAAVMVRRGRSNGGWLDRESVADGSEAIDPVDPALLANDEQVLALLERRGGRLKQQEIVRELGWSETKTSEVVGEMDESGQIERFRLGRENVISLPDAE